MHNKSLNKINIINNNNRYLNFNILPGVKMNSPNEIQKISDNIFNYSDIYNDINKDNDDNIKKENENNVNNEDEEEDEKDQHLYNKLKQ